LSGQTPARRALLVLTFVSVVATAALVGARLPASTACPVALPKPLRVLYEESELVAVARVGDSVAVTTGEDMAQLKTALHLSSLLKGESKERVVNLHHLVWKEMDGSAPPAYAKNDVLLVFLNADENGDGYLSADDERGMKKLSPDDLKVYLRRIEELATITRGEKPDAAALTEWLVRCAEEPATRWEGAYELAADASLFRDREEARESSTVVAPKTGLSVQAAGNIEVQEMHDDNSAARAAVAAAAEMNVENNRGNESGARVEPAEIIRRLIKAEKQSDFASLLTPVHKQRLTNALLAAEELDEGEQMLLRLVGNWKDARLVPYSLQHLARMTDQPPPHAEDLMRIVAHALADKTLIKFVADYSEAASYDDLYNSEDYVEEEDREATAEERAETRKAVEEMKAAAASARLQRSGKLRHFLALADQPQSP
jgi:hypothetical protein